jgi:anti-sigma B factor antagonist
LKVQVLEKSPGIYIASLEGEFDMSTSPAVRSALVPLFGKDSVCHVIVDLSAVPYIDSSGIATLVEGLHLSRKANVRFTLAGATSSVEAVFDLAYLKSVFEMVPDVSGLFAAEEPR